MRYSSRSATTGSTRVARRVGSQAAAAKRQAQKDLQDAEQHGVWEARPRLAGAAAPRLQSEPTGVYWPEEWPV